MKTGTADPTQGKKREQTKNTKVKNCCQIRCITVEDLRAIRAGMENGHILALCAGLFVQSILNVVGLTNND